MANKNASVGHSLSYVGAGAGTVSERSKSVTAPYLGAEPGQILDVPSGAAAGVTYGIAFGSIDEATMMRVDNNCTCPITLRVNSETDGGIPIAAGGFMVVAGPTTAAGATGGVLASAEVILGGTQGWVDGTQTTLNGNVGAWVFGDPE